MPANQAHDDVWIPTVCNLCFSFCPIKVHRVDGVVVKIEGNPDDPQTQGRICAKGQSGINILYDPGRLNYPVKRTNPEKGFGVDPKWQRISWEEALTTIVERLGKIRADDPRKLLLFVGVTSLGYSSVPQSFTMAFGSPNWNFSGAGVHCAAAKHFIGCLNNAAWVCWPDFDYCDYFLNFGGVPVGTGAYYANNAAARKMADARARGMRHVVIDPYRGMAAQSCDEWIPIRPGTDAVVALAMANLLVNEYHLYDREFLEEGTNAPYLVGADGRYVRGQDGKPQMWDEAENRAKPYDAAFQKIALEAEPVIDGKKASTAFLLISDHLKRYTAEMASEISTIPADTIRRIAREFGEAARIGSTIELEGNTYPYRPIAVGLFRGASAHKHASLNAMALELLGALAGVRATPGAYPGLNARSLGHPDTGLPHYSPKVGLDGMLETGRWVIPPGQPWPPVYPEKPDDVGLCKLSPASWGQSSLHTIVPQDPARYGIDYTPEFAFTMNTNIVMSVANPKQVGELFRKMFTVNFNIFLDETTEFADIVLPDTCYLERLDIEADWLANQGALGYWSYPLRQPVVEPVGEQRQVPEVFLEIADRLGMRADLNMVLNGYYGFREGYQLEPDRRYTVEEIADHRYRSWFGDKFDLAWFKKNAILTWPRKAEEIYWDPFVKARIPVYYEHFLAMRDGVEAVKAETGLFADLDSSDYQPIPDWKPCPSYTESREEYDLYAVYFRVPFHSFTLTGNDAWVDEVSTIDPYTNGININSATARKKDVKEGDWIELRSAANGETVRGRAHLTEAVHPEVVAVSGHGGHWAKALPLASMPGKGVAFDRLLPIDFDHVDTPSFNLDLCAKVKVSKVAGP